MKQFFISIAFVSVAIIQCFAYDFIAGELCYNINPDGKSVSVTYRFPNAPSYNSEDLPSDIVIPENVAYNDVNYTVTAIGHSAFSGCNFLKSLALPGTLNTIEGNAFLKCSGLATISFPETITSVGLGALTDTQWYKSQPDGIVYVGSVAYRYKGEAPTGSSINLKEGTVMVSPYAFHACGGLTKVVLPGSLETIGQDAFHSCRSLTEINFPQSLSTIGDNAFSFCSALSTVVLPESVQTIGKRAFSDCDRVRKAVLDCADAKIGDCLFQGCDKLMNVVWNVKSYYLNSVDNAPFKGCSQISSFEFGEDVTMIPNFICNNLRSITDIVIPNSVISIGKDSFKECRGLTKVKLGSSVQSIGETAFCDCQNLESIEFGESLASIGNFAFLRCIKFKIISLPKSLKSVGYSAFEECDNLKEVHIKDLAAWCGIHFDNEKANPLCHGCYLNVNGVTIADLVIPNNVEAINDYVFYGCAGLTSITFPVSLKSLGKKAFSRYSNVQNVTWNARNFSNFNSNNTLYNFLPNISAIKFGNEVEKIPDYICSQLSQLTDIDFGESASEIGEGAFSHCPHLTEVQFSSSLKSIGALAFTSCTGLTKMNIPNSIISIGTNAFAYCSELTSVTLGNNLKSIGDGAFYTCSRLTRVDSYSDPSDVEMGSSVFSSVTKDGTLHVLPIHFEAYKSAEQWRDFRIIIDDLEEIEGVEIVTVNELDSDLPVEIYDLSGRRFYESIDNLPTGSYILRQGRKVAKIVK